MSTARESGAFVPPPHRAGRWNRTRTSGVCVVDGRSTGGGRRSLFPSAPDRQILLLAPDLALGCRGLSAVLAAAEFSTLPYRGLNRLRPQGGTEMDERMKTHGDFGWCDLMTDEPEKARAFYTDVIGWTTEVVDIGKGPYTVLKTGQRPVAGIMGKPPEASGAPTAWTAYVTVDDVDARAARVEGRRRRGDRRPGRHPQRRAHGGHTGSDGRRDRHHHLRRTGRLTAADRA